MRNKHVVMLLMISLFSTMLVFSEDRFYRVLRDTSLFHEGFSISPESYAGEISAGEKVRRATDFWLADNGMKNDEPVMIGRLSYRKGTEMGAYNIFANDLAPWDTEDMFDSGLLTRFTGPNQRKWIESSLVKMLRNKTRDSFLDTNVYFNEMYNPGNDYRGDIRTEWYEMLSIFIGTRQNVFFIFSNSAVVNDVNIYLKNITRVSDGYVLAAGTTQELGYKEFNWFDHDWASVEGKENNFTMTLKIDGDFMDVYLENEPTKFATYELVEQKIIDEIVKLLNTESCDLAGVNWPLRASDLGGTGLIYRTVDRLKLRKSESRSSNVIRTLDIGAGMILLSKGSEETIDGITAPWVQVKTETGETGWCFGGYLDPKP